MTYLQLANIILGMTPEQQQMDVTLADREGEFYAAALCFTDAEADVLDANHPFLRIESEEV